MQSPDLAGRTILIFEDEPLIALDIADEFQVAGAEVLTATKLEVALQLAATRDLSAAIIDLGLDLEQGAVLRDRLKERSIPYLHYGAAQAERTSSPSLSKPALRGALANAVAELLAGRSGSLETDVVPSESR